MTKLLRSNFSRLWKNKLFYIGLIAIAGFGVFVALERTYAGIVLQEAGYNTPDGLLFMGAMFFPVVIAVFDSMFIGAEYSDKTLRNKLIVGHSRAQVYLSNLIVTSVATLLMHLVYIVTVLAVATPLLDNFETPVRDNIMFFICSIGVIIALNSFAVMLCMLISNKAVSVIACILLSIGFIVLGVAMDSVLQAPEFFEGYSYTYDGILFEIPTERNPDYIDGTARNILQFFSNLLPGTQGVALAQQSVAAQRAWMLPFYSISFAMITILGGVLSFKRRDLK